MKKLPHVGQLKVDYYLSKISAGIRLVLWPVRGLELKAAYRSSSESLVVDRRGDSRLQQPQETVVGAGGEAYQFCDRGKELQYYLSIQSSVL